MVYSLMEDDDKSFRKDLARAIVFFELAITPMFLLLTTCVDLSIV